MYETEANYKTESTELIPSDVVSSFGSLTGTFLSRTTLPWSEHCTECVWPTCYKTCDLYSPREDGRCRRFVDGMVRMDCPDAVNGYLLKIRFKQWGKLWTPASLNLHAPEKAIKIEEFDYRLGMALYRIPLPVPIKSVITRKRYGWKKKKAIHGPVDKRVPTSLVLECYNPNDSQIDLSLTIRSVKREQRIPFQKLLLISRGYQLIRIPFKDIESVVDLTSPFNVELIPNGTVQEATLYFGLMDFVEEVVATLQKSDAIKCVIWDLDNTIWNGVLIEDGPDNLTLKPDIMRIIEGLDDRGILQSIVSKNNPDDAQVALKRFGLEEFFLYPKISWSPKGAAVKEIAKNLNIGLDSILFIDDQVFERMQVEASCPEVRVLDASEHITLLQKKELDVPITAESKNRRRMYQVEKERQELHENYKDDYSQFLRDCNISLTICSLTADNLERVHELTQRTNQMNFSGTRYDRILLKEVASSPFLDTYVLSCEDRFGSYGIVGFGIVDHREPRLTDLMFSCRIQSKRVEHAFLRTIILKYIRDTGRDFHANYRKTTRNMPSGQVFDDLGMAEVATTDGITSLIMSKRYIMPDDNIIKVNMNLSNIAASRT